MQMAGCSFFRRQIVVAAVCAAFVACSQSNNVTEGPCTISISATLARAADGGAQSFVAGEGQDTGIAIERGQQTNVTVYFESKFDFQYQANVAESGNGMVVQTLVPTTFVDVAPDDNSVYIWDVVPVETTGLDGRYTINVGAHIDVDPEKHRCTEPLDAEGRLIVSTWKTFGITVGEAGSSSSSSSGGSTSSAGSSSSAAQSSSTVSSSSSAGSSG